MVVVSSGGGNSNNSISLVNSMTSGAGNAVVLSAPSAMSNAQLMSQGAAQNSIRLPIQQQQQQHLIMAPMNNLMFSNYLQSGHPVLTQAGNQYIIQNLPALSNPGIFQLPPHSSNLTTITNRRSTVSSAQNIQPRPQQSQQLLPASMGQQVYRTNLSPQIIAQNSGTTPTNIQPRPQSFPMIRTTNLTPQLFAPQSFQPIFSQNQSGLCWTGSPAANSGFILRSQADPIQFLTQTQPPLQIPFVQNNVQVPSTPTPIAPVSAVAAVSQATSQVTTSATATAARFKPIATRPVAHSSSMGTQTTPRTTTTVADTTNKNTVRPKLPFGPTTRPAVVSSSPSSSKLPNGPVTQVREAETSVHRSSPASVPKATVMKPDVSSTNPPVTQTPESGVKMDLKSVKGNGVSAVRKENKEPVADRSPAVKRSIEKRDSTTGSENNSVPAPPLRKAESPRLKNGFKTLTTESKKAEADKTGPGILIHVIEDFVIEESSKPFPVNGSADPPVSENGSCRSEGISNRSDSPEEMSTPRPRLASDAGECQVCQKTGPKSRLKMRNGVRACATCILKKPSSKVGLFNPVTSSLSEYDFPANEQQSGTKDVPTVESEAGNGNNDGRKKARLSKKVSTPAATPVTWLDFCLGWFITCLSSNDQPVKPVDVAPTPSSGTPVAPVAESVSPSVRSEVAGLFLPESGSDPLKWNVCPSLQTLVRSSPQKHFSWY